jgi:hypothetical protein
MVPKSVAEIFAAGQQNDVPTILGWNADDGVSFNAPPTPGHFAPAPRECTGIARKTF